MRTNFSCNWFGFIEILHKQQEVIVMASVRVNIQCQCGELLLTKMNSDKGTITGFATCPACKKRCRWTITDGVGFAGYKK